MSRKCKKQAFSLRKTPVFLLCASRFCAGGAGAFAKVGFIGAGEGVDRGIMQFCGNLGDAFVPRGEVLAREFKFAA